MSKCKKCPLLKGKCIESNCMFFTHLIGKNPQTGQDIDEFNCAIALLPILLIENARNVVGAQAAVESFRNKSTEFQDNLIATFSAIKQLQAPVKKERKQIKKVVDAIDVEVKES